MPRYHIDQRAFPTLDRPMNAISARSGFGQFPGLELLITNAAFWIIRGNLNTKVQFKVKARVKLLKEQFSFTHVS